MKSLDAILRPRSIAVIGASRQPNTIGWQILDNLLRNGFTGPVYPVNPKAASIHSIPAYPSVSEIPGAVDLGIIVVPKEHVLKVVEECVEFGVKGFVVITAGFKEIGGEGIEREEALVKLVRLRNLRMVGPNCMGVINTEESVSMNATFAPSTPPPGRVAFMSQSGAIGVSILDYAKSLGIGVSMFASVGNKSDVSGNDLLEYWADDPNTGVVLLYLENFGNPSHFIELGERITPHKPICVVKSGRTGAGARAAASHTGVLAQTDLVTDAIIRQAGALRAQSVEEMFDLAMAFSTQPLPGGNRVAIVTNAGGPGIMLADACEAGGLEVGSLSPETEKALRDSLPEEASVRNPVDMIASATAESYEHAIRCVLDDENVDAAIAAFVPPLGIHAKDIAAALVRVNRERPDKPLLAVLMGRQGLPGGLAQLREAEIPGYLFPESAALALSAMWRQSRRAQRQPGRILEFEVDDDAVRGVIERTLEAGHHKVSEPDALEILEAYRIPVVPWSFVSSDNESGLTSEAARAAEELGFPVALKVVSPDIVHKTDVGGVALDLGSQTAVQRAVRQMTKTIGAVTNQDGSSPRIEGVLIQAMATEGRETIVGLTRMPRVGPMVMFGLGGIFVETVRDVALRMSPLMDVDADEMIREVKTYRLLEGLRGEPARDLDALSEVLLRVSQLAVRHPEISEMDINPLLALERGTAALDARIQVTAVSD